MSTYTYRARDTIGKLVKGTMEAASKDELIDRLRKMGYMTTQVTEVLGGINIGSAVEKFQRISTEDMIVFNIQLANMINAGMGLLTSLKGIREQIGNKRLREVIGKVTRNIEAGDSFSDALARHPRIFSKLFINMVKVGEASGKLDVVLNRFAIFIEHQADLKQKIRGALLYPVILMVASVAIIAFIISFVMPNFVRIFNQAGVDLPLPTMILYKLGIMVKKYWWLIILGIISVILGIGIYVKTARGKLQFDKFKLKLPVIGSLTRKLAISRFARTLATMIESGVPILQCLDIVRDIIGNEVIAGVVKNTRESVEKGEEIAESLKISEEFPPDTVQMIAVGEKTGNLDGMLNKISDFYDKAIGYSIIKLTALLEPAFLVIIGAVVAFIMASMLLPMFDMVKTLRR